MPPVAAAIATVGQVLATEVVFGLTVGNILTAAYMVGSAVEQRRAARRAARSAQAAYYASLQDRSVMVRTAVAPRNYVYGQDKVSGPVVDMFTTGDKQQYLHILVALAARPVDGIPIVYFNEYPISEAEIDTNGFVTSEQWRARTAGTPTVVGMLTSGAGQVTLPRAAAEVVSITGFDSSTQAYDQLSGWAHTPGTALITGLPPGINVDVSYTWRETHARVRIHKFLGDHGSVPTALLDETNGRRTAAHVGHGIAWLWVRLEWDDDVFGQIGVPSISALVRGHRVQDPRTGLTAWSDNAALCAADFARDQHLGMGCTADEVPAAELIAEANICDERVPVHDAGLVDVTNGSTEVVGASAAVDWQTTRVAVGDIFTGPDGVHHVIAAVQWPTPRKLVLATPYTGATAAGVAYSISQQRYTCRGTVSAADGRLTSFDALLEAMAGHAVWTQGRWRIRAGAHPTPEPITITVDHLADTPPRWQRSAARRELVNAISCTYREPSSDYTELQAPPVTNSTYEAQDGGRRITRQVQLNMVQHALRAQRLGKVMLERARQSETLEIETNLRAYNLAPGQVVPVTIERYGWAAKLFEVRSRELDLAAGTIRYVLRGTAPEVWDWNMGEATTVDPAPDTQLPSPFVRPPAPTGLVLATGTPTLLLLSDGTIVARVLAEWDQVQDAFVLRGGRIEVRWRPQADPAWRSEAALPGDATERLIGPLDEGVPVVVQVRAVNAAGRASDWTSDAIIVQGKGVPPSNVVGFGGSVTKGIITYVWDACPDLDYAHTEVRASDANWGSDTDQPLFRGRANQWTEFVSSTGTYTRYARHFDTSGNPSVSSASGSVTVTDGDLASVATLSFSPPTVNLTYVPGVGITNAAQGVTQVSVKDQSGNDLTSKYNLSRTDNGLTSTLSGTTLTINNVGSGGSAPYVVFFARLNGTLDDEGPYELTGTKGSDVTVSSSGGPFADTGCATFNGVVSPWGNDGQINYSVPAEITPADVNVSLSLWVKFDNVNSGTFQPLVGLGSFLSVEFYGAGWTGGQPQIVFNWFSFRENISSNSTSPSVFDTITASTSALISNTWHFIEVVYNKASSKMFLFIDGAKISERTSTVSGQSLGLIWQRNAVYGQNHATILRIGRNYQAGYSYGTYGSIAEVCLQVGGPVPTANYSKPTAPRGVIMPPAAASVLVTATPKAGGASISDAFYAYTTRAAAPTIVVVPSRTTGVVEADWDNTNQAYSQSAMTYQVLVDGVDQTSQWQARGIHNAPSADMSMSLSRGSFVVTSKSSTGNITATINLGRVGYRTQVLEYLISTSYRGQRTVIPGGTTSLTVQSDWNDANRLNLPLACNVVALDGNTVVTSSYSWSVSASSGLTLSASTGSSVNLTGMASGTNSGTITFTGTRASWPTLTWTVTVSKTKGVQPTVLPSGTTSLAVAATWDDAANTNLPLAGSVSAIEQGSNSDVTSSYTWAATGSAGLTVTNTGAAFSLTAMASGTLTGTVTMTGTRASWPTLTWTTSVTKGLAPQQGVVASGTATLQVRATWDDVTRLNLPLSGSVAATDQASGATVTSSYTWASSASSGVTVTNTGAAFSLTGMASGTNGGTVTMTGTRSGWPTLVWTTAVTKVLDAQPVVVAGGPTAIVVAGSTDGTVPSINLPVSATVTAIDAGTNVASSYAWSVSASSGITASISSGSTVQVTAMGDSTDTGALTVTGTRANWPTLTWVIAVSKTRLLLPYNKVVAQMPPISVFAFAGSGATATAQVRFNTDGTIQTNTGSGWASAGQWYNPTGGTPGNSHDIFLNGTWSALTSAVTYSVSGTDGGNGLAGTAMIAASSARTVILGSVPLNLYAYGTP